MKVDVKGMPGRIYLPDFSEQFGGSGDEEKYSAEDKTFLKLLNQQRSLVDGHYRVTLPFREFDVNFPNNRFLTIKRLEHLKKKFLKSETFFDEYKMCINKMLANEYAEKSVGNVEHGKSWYVPYHELHHPVKPGNSG